MTTQMRILNINSLQTMLQQFSKSYIYPNAANHCQNNYHFTIQTISASEMLQLAKQIVDRQCDRFVRKYKESTTDGIAIWAAGEQKLLCWLTVCYCYVHKLDIYKLTMSQMQPISAVFQDKDVQVLIFEVRNKIMPNTNCKKVWSCEEQNLLISMMEKEHNWVNVKSNFKWKYISFEMFKAMKLKHFRSARECREKWTNYLDPSIQKTKWTREQDLNLFENMYVCGSRWSVIAKQLNSGRTENMVKNRVLSILKKVFKRPVKNLTKSHLQTLKVFVNKSEQEQQSYKPKIKNTKSLTLQKKQINCQQLKDKLIDGTKTQMNSQLSNQTENYISSQTQQQFFNSSTHYSRPINQEEMMLIDQILALPTLTDYSVQNIRMEGYDEWMEQPQSIQFDWDI